MLRRFMSIALLAAAASAQGRAAAIVLWPVDPTIAAGQTATALWVENRGPQPVTLQVRALGWIQADAKDSYDRQDEVVTSPPIASVAPGQRQLIRILRREIGTAAAEHSYRLLIDELPPPIDPAKPNAASAQLSVQMRYSIPLFTYDGDVAARPALTARTVIIDGQRYAEFRNVGQRHARLVNLRIQTPAKEFTVNSGLIGYVLVGSTMRWLLPEGMPNGTILVNVNGADTSLAPIA
ncbi:fimbrial biogenesis chaperone [Sphingomonas morindae]|uniref:Fimbria/pilus periplasmic chaperone n=1 Tax=Sphingomonas morindae TaxID=1541170 RepID=A0ABY4X3Y7_9SPHN|nr:fimbria/pilus periplasmic chaperone [Sphingomonas morindae]USI71598.1 fimbria/pilus periplasmic chaperone [Sphingomonas morindae]